MLYTVLCYRSIFSWVCFLMLGFNVVSDAALTLKTSQINIGTRGNFAHTQPTSTAFLIVSCSNFPTSFLSLYVPFPEGILLFPGSFASSFWATVRTNGDVNLFQLMDQIFPLPFLFAAIEAQSNKSRQHRTSSHTLLGVKMQQKESHKASTPWPSLRD